MQCSSGMRQVGIGLHNRHDVFGVLPYGQYNTIAADATGPTHWNRACWWHAVLPYVEQKSLYDALDAYMNQTRARRTLSLQATTTAICRAVRGGTRS